MCFKSIKNPGLLTHLNQSVAHDEKNEARAKNAILRKPFYDANCSENMCERFSGNSEFNKAFLPLY